MNDFPETGQNQYWLNELTLDDVRAFVQRTADAPGDIPVVVHHIEHFSDEVRHGGSANRLDVATEAPILAAVIDLESFSERDNEVDNRYIASKSGEERTHLCTIYLNVVSARNVLREDTDEFGRPR